MPYTQEFQNVQAHFSNPDGVCYWTVARASLLARGMRRSVEALVGHKVHQYNDNESWASQRRGINTRFRFGCGLPRAAVPVRERERSGPLAPHISQQVLSQHSCSFGL